MFNLCSFFPCKWRVSKSSKLSITKHNSESTMSNETIDKKSLNSNLKSAF